ncbi:MAG: DUF4345 family protein [Methylocystis sp.]|nr:DUF4345 family protein [Methylocystis sp.]
MTGMLANIFLIGYALVCIGSGMAGIFSTYWELPEVFRIPLTTLPADALLDFLAHYRFMKAIELTFGLFILLNRRDILDGAQPALIFLAGCLFGVLVRGGTWWFDGAPTLLFKLVLLSEIITLLLVFIYSRRDRGA